MGKASSRKKDRRAHLEAPAVIRYRSEWRQGQAESLEQYRKYLAGIDAPPGKPIEFGHVFTRREMRKLQLELVQDLEKRPKLDPFDVATYQGAT